VFKTTEFERIWRTSYQSRRQAENAIVRYIGGSYNPVRRHSASATNPKKFEDEAKQETMTIAGKSALSGLS